LSLASEVYAVYIVVGVICRRTVVALKTPPSLGSPSTTSGPRRRSSCLLAAGGSARRDNRKSGHTRVGGTATPVAAETMSIDDDSESASEETRSADEELRVGKHKSAFRVFFFPHNTRTLLPAHIEVSYYAHHCPYGMIRDWGSSPHSRSQC
jgi:hypothetical protein